MVDSYTLEYYTNYTKATTVSDYGYYKLYPTTSGATCTAYKECDTWDWSSSTTAITWNEYGTGKIIQKVKTLYDNAWESNIDNYYFKWEKGESVRFPPISAQERLRQIIQSRQTPLVIVRRKPMLSTEDHKEQRARETLRRILGEDKFRSFVRNGFVTVRARSGLAYQIFPGHGITAVYRDGQMVERLCVVLRGNFPPTDSLIMRYLLILNDEKDFRSHAISHSVAPMMAKQTRQPDQKPLTEIFRKLKVA